MSLSLPLKYRPQQFSEIVGQRLSIAALNRMVELEQVPHGLLFSGPSGSGKTSSARILASSLGYTGTQIIEIDAASNRGVDNVRTLTEGLRYGAGGNVVLLDEAHNLTKEAFNALLKTLEEPTPGTVFVLLTTEPQRIPENVLSRLIEFPFKRISTAEILDRLLLVSTSEGFQVPDSVLVFIATEAEGNLRSALNSLELVILSGIQSIEDLKELSGSSDFAPYLAELMLNGDYTSIFSELDTLLSSVSSPSDISASLLSLYRDLLVLRAGGTLPLEGTALESRKSLSIAISREALLQVVKLLWDLRTRTRESDDPRGSLEMVVILMSDVLSSGRRVSATSPVVESKRAQPAAPTKAPAGKVSLSEMRSN